MLIIEGSDNVGKTTACRKMEVLIGKGSYRHLSRPPDDFDHVREYMERIGPYVQDRFHLGAITYGRMTKNGNCPTSRDMLMVQRYMRWQGCIVVVMHAERDWLRRSTFNKGEMYPLDTILDVNSAFIALTKTTNRGEPYCDLAYDVSKRGYPSDETLSEWVDLWRSRWNG
jgi:hypothetical protein